MSSRERQDKSRKKFKSVRDPEEARRQRSALQELARKEKRVEQANQRRRKLLSQADDGGGSKDDVIKAEELSLARNVFIQQHVDVLLQKLNGPVFEDQLAAVMQIRKMLSVEDQPPIDRIIELGIVPRLLDLLIGVNAGQPPQNFVEPVGYKLNKRTPVCPIMEKLQFEAAWALTNIGSGTSDQTKCLVRCGAVPRLLQLLTSAGTREELRDQCVWALGNVAGDGPDLRDWCLEQGMLPALLMQFTDQADVCLIRNACWALSNLYRGKPPPPLPLVLPGLPCLTRLLQYPDPETQADAAWAFSYVTDAPDEYVTAACAQPGAMEQLVHLLNPNQQQQPGLPQQHQQQQSSSSSSAASRAALRTVGNVVSGSAAHTQRIVDLNPFDQLCRLAVCSRKEARKEACWALSNVTAGTQPQIHQCIVNGVMPVLVDRLLNDQYVVRKEACWAVANACQGATHEQIRLFVTNELLYGLIQMGISEHANRTVKMIVLEAVECILDAGVYGGHPSACIYLDQFEELDGLLFLDDAALHDDDEVAEKACFLLETYFYYETEDLLDDEGGGGTGGGDGYLLPQHHHEHEDDGGRVLVENDYDGLEADSPAASAQFSDFSFKF